MTSGERARQGLPFGILSRLSTGVDVRAFKGAIPTLAFQLEMGNSEVRAQCQLNLRLRVSPLQCLLRDLLDLKIPQSAREGFQTPAPFGERIAVSLTP